MNMDRISQFLVSILFQHRNFGNNWQRHMSCNVVNTCSVIEWFGCIKAIDVHTADVPSLNVLRQFSKFVPALVQCNDTTLQPTQLLLRNARQSVNAGVSIPMGQGGHVPPIFMKRDVHGNVPPPNILEVMSFRLGLFYPVTATTVVCCIFYANIMCSFTKSFSFWGTPSPRPSVFFYVPSKKSCEIDTLECTERGQS